ncbi:DUF4286 family protein [Polaromonas aquatica]|uniref:DUF4286 family protein n=2 Tax=Comamonadaceae TaxID=80864 RepID=A0ABW1TZG7_9BURK
MAWKQCLSDTQSPIIEGRTMKDAGYFYVVKFWVAPEGKTALMKWLADGHVAEVVSQPGFLWCRQLDLRQKDDKGWEAHSMIYGIESRAAFERYSADTALAAKFVEQRKSFVQFMRIERWDAPVVAAYDRPA